MKITPSEVRKSADAAESSADQVAKLELASALKRVADLLPSTDAATAAGEAGAAWDRDKGAWVKSVRTHVTSTRQDVQAIVDADEQAAAGGRQRQQVVSSVEPGASGGSPDRFVGRLGAN